MEDKDVLCFLCQTKTSIENICPHCTQNIYYCSKSHFEAHRGLIRADENTAKVCLIHKTIIVIQNFFLSFFLGSMLAFSRKEFTFGRQCPLCIERHQSHRNRARRSYLYRSWTRF